MTDTKPRRWPFARGSETTIAIVAILAVGTVALWLHWGHFLTAVLAIVLIATLLFLFYFLRDPERQSPAGDGLFVAPADGRVVTVQQTEEPTFLQGPAIQISTFMSPLDVHVRSWRKLQCSQYPSSVIVCSRNLRVLLLAVLVLIALPGIVSAQGGNDPEIEAQRHIELAQAYEDAGMWEKAEGLFEWAEF